MVFSIEFRPAVLKTLQRLPKRDPVRIRRRIDDLATHLPDPATTKMKGENSFRKIRSGDYRIIYGIPDNRLVTLVVKGGHRKNVYKNLP